MTAVDYTAPGTVTPRMSEKQFQDKVVALAQTLGWKVSHFGAGMTARGSYRTACRYDGKGFPDLVLVHPERGLVWFRELKAGDRPNRPLEPEQDQWQVWLAQTGGNVAVWRPSDWPDIVASLSSGRAWVQS